jgi:hypothetical protein
MTDEVRSTPDWERIEADYRAGILSLREIATKDGKVTEGAIRKRAKKLAWPRDLTARIHAKADELVRREAVRNDGTQLQTANPESEKGIVEENAAAIAGVRLRHRGDIFKGSKLCIKLIAELESVTDGQLELDRLQELLEQFDGVKADDRTAQKAREALAKAMSLPSRAVSMKSLADSLRTLVTLERESWGLESLKNPADDNDRPIINIGFANGGPGAASSSA